MPDWPELTILLVTYDRPQEIRRTIKALLKHLQYPRERLTWLLADDSSPKGYVRGIKHDYPDLHWIVSITERGGWGRNVNSAMKSAKTDYIFLIEDDQVACKSLNLKAGVALMEAKPEVALVRLDGVAAHVGLTLELREAKDTLAGRLDYLVIKRRESSHLNVYSNRPHLKHRRFHDKVGYYPEKLPLAMTETTFAHKVRDARECPEIAILDDGVVRAFDHVGKSRQNTEHDKPT